MNVGVQLYTLRKEIEQDFIGTLQKVKEIGYTGVEFAGYGSFTGKELKDVLSDLELTPVSSHVPITELENKLSRVLEFGVEIGLQYIVCPFPKDSQGGKRDYEELAESLNRIGEACKRAGIQLCYHHHDFECVRFDGEYALNLLLARTNPDFLMLEMDVYWAQMPMYHRPNICENTPIVVPSFT
ncbi:sugar phosphate isomerase/epimerase family protein [Effusibacillus consociatus]|uniref:Sugar phosphate isomerase/epimerase family protein n=1 Tax=Effusibacillus consociatus TaxID=1117041 RepID=A0ABV9Q829_9BACL